MEKLIEGLISGAFAGYITNDLAISMLFKKYLGRFGGVIVKTRQEFEKNVSVLIEKQIINCETLNPELRKPEFRKNIELITGLFYDTYLKNDLVNKKVSEIEGIDNSLTNLENLLLNSENLAKITENIWDDSFAKIKIKKIVGEKSLNKIVNEVFAISFKMLFEQKSIKKLVNGLTNEYEKENMETILGEKIFKVVENNLLLVTSTLDKKLQDEYQEDVNLILENFIKELKIDEIIKNTTTTLLNKEVIEVFGEKKALLFINTLKKEFINYLCSLDGKETVKKLSKEIITNLKNVDNSILDILGPDVKNKVEQFLDNELPEIIDEIISWLNENQVKFNAAIEKSIDKGIDRSGFLQKMICKILRSVIDEKISSKYGILDKVVKYFEKNRNNKDISREIAKNIFTFLNEKKIGDILKELEAKNVFDGENIEKLIVIGAEKLQDNLTSEVILSLLKNVRVKDFILDKNSLDKLVKAKLEKKIFEQVEAFLANKEVKKELDLLLKRKFKEIKESKLEVYKGQIEKKSEIVEEKILEILESYQDEFKLSLNNYLNLKLANVSVKDSFDFEQKTLILERSRKNLKEYLVKNKTLVKEQSLENIYTKIKQMKDIKGQTTDLLLYFTDENLERFLQGNIEKVASANIKKLSNEELNKLVKNFMGTELKKINIFGAFLGAGVGLGTAFIPSNIILNAGIFGLIGIVTNIIAVEMIFKPYNKKLGIQGVLPKGKKRFAKDMSGFVNENLLNKEKAMELFEDKKEFILKELAKECSEDNYQLIKQLLNKNRIKIFELSFKILQDKIIANKENLSLAIIEETKSVSLKNISLEKYTEEINNLKKEVLLSYQDIFSEKIAEKVKANKSLNELVGKELKEQSFKLLERNINEGLEYKLTNSFSVEKINGFIIDYLNKEEQMLDYKIKDLFPEENIKNVLNNYFKSIQDKGELERLIVQNLKNSFNDEFKSERKIKYLFEGKLMQIVTSNKDQILEALLEKIISVFKENEQEIIDESIGAIRDEIGVMESFGYELIGGDEIIEKIVKSFIYEEVPDLLDDSKARFDRIIVKIFNDFSELKTSELSMEIETKEIKSIVNNILVKPKIEEKIVWLKDGVCERILENTSGFYLNQLQINSLVELYSLVEVDVKKGLLEANSNLKKNKSHIIKSFSPLMVKVIEKSIYSKPISTFLLDESKQSLNSEYKRFYKKIILAKAFNKESEVFLEGLREKIEQEELKSFIDLDNLKINIEKILSDEKLYQDIKSSIITNDLELFANLTKEFVDSIDSKTKAYFIDQILGPLVDSFEANFSGVLESLNIAEVTENEIKKMDNKELEELFLKIAGKYFRKLKLYGLNGFVFGLNNFLTGACIVSYLIMKAKGGKETKKSN